MPHAAGIDAYIAAAPPPRAALEPVIRQRLAG